MTSFIEIILLVFIAAFLVLQNKGGLLNLVSKRRKLILDSCGLIDGRIVEIVKTGFLVDELVIPQFILNELQMLADGNDSHKRERARFGLDIAHELQDTAFNAKVTIDRTLLPEVHTTDDKLIHLAKKMEAFLYTTDYNLSKVASIEGVGVLNINELSQGLRPVALPGETLKIKIIQKGSNPSQGVGYLEDGTMIVVEGGARHAGRAAVDVTVTRMHQTVAGKMVFGLIKDQPTSSNANAAHTTSRHAQQAKAVAQQVQQPQSTLRERLSRPSPTAVSDDAVAPPPQAVHASRRRGHSGGGRGHDTQAHTPTPQNPTKPQQNNNDSKPQPPRRSSTRAASFQKIM